MSITKPSNAKIGRPPLKQQQQVFKKRFQRHKTRYQLQSQLLLLIYNIFHHQQVQDKGNSSKSTDEQLQQVFDYYKQKELYEVLMKHNRLYYQEQVELREEEKVDYSSLVDISYIYKVVKEFRSTLTPSAFDNLAVFLPFIFYLHNQKLLNDRFLCYFSPKMDSHGLIDMMFEGPSLFADDLSLLIISFLLEVMDKQKISLQREKYSYEPHPMPYPLNSFHPMMQGNPMGHFGPMGMRQMMGMMDPLQHGRMCPSQMYPYPPVNKPNTKFKSQHENEESSQISKILRFDEMSEEPIEEDQVEIQKQVQRQSEIAQGVKQEQDNEQKSKTHAARKHKISKQKHSKQTSKGGIKPENEKGDKRQ